MTEEEKIVEMSTYAYQSIDIEAIETITPESHPCEIELLRFAECDEDHVKIKMMAFEIFTHWNQGADEYITYVDIASSGIDSNFAQDLERLILNGQTDDLISLSDLTNFFTMLSFGTMKVKINLLLIFLDRNGDQMIGPEELEIYFKNYPKEIFAKLDMLESDNKMKTLRYEDIIQLFESAPRGEEAINMFCSRLLKEILRSKPQKVNQLQKRSSLLNIVSRTWKTNESKSCGNPMRSFTKIYYIIKRIPKSAMFTASMIFLQLALWQYYFSYHRSLELPYAISVAKGFGINLRILTIIMFLTMARTTMGWLYSYKLTRWFIPMGFNSQIHSFVGFCLVLHTIGHVIAHAINQSSFVNQVGWTGIVLVVILLAMASTALLRGFSSNYYKLFTLVHFGYVLWFIFVFVHVPFLWPYFVSIGGLFGLERAYDIFFCTTHSTLLSSRPCANGVTFLSIPRSAPSTSGAYYRVKIPAISPVEWHPFSLASSSTSHHLTFFVASVGDWTKQLLQIVSDPELRKHTSVQVQGPFYAPAKIASEDSDSNIMLVANGIGITPFFSVMATRVFRQQNIEGDKEIFTSLFNETLTFPALQSVDTMQSLNIWRVGNLAAELESDASKGKLLHLVWTIRDATELIFYIDYVYGMVKHQDHFSHPVVIVDIYLTGLGNSTDPKFMLAHTLFLLTISQKSSKCMNIHFGRPNLNDIVKTDNPDMIFYCGNAALKDALADICTTNGVEFHPEDFDSGAKFVKDLMAYFHKIVLPQQKVVDNKLQQRKSMMTKKKSNVKSFKQAKK